LLRMAAATAFLTAACCANPTVELCQRQSGAWDEATQTCDYGEGGLTFKALKKSTRCFDDADGRVPLRRCWYSIDRLRIELISAGTNRASIAIDGADESLGYGVGVLTWEACIRVAPGARIKELEPSRRTEDAFVSTWSGDVYDSLTLCSMEAAAARRDGRSTQD
jgi:hypothetical protein